jgi:hypothetical protein
MDASFTPNSAYSTEPRALHREFAPDRVSAAEAPRLTRRASLTIALLLSLSLWTGIGSAIHSLLSILRG